MPDTPGAPHEGAPQDSAIEARVSRLEEDRREMKTGWSRMEASLVRIETLLEATLPHLATKADIADRKPGIARRDAAKPGKTCIWGILAVLLTAYACGLAALAILK